MITRAVLAKDGVGFMLIQEGLIVYITQLTGEHTGESRFIGLDGYTDPDGFPDMSGWLTRLEYRVVN